MFERMDNGRIYIYKKYEGRSGYVTWEKILRFNNFPTDLIKTTQHPFILSPDFNYYIDIDRHKHIFYIRDTFTQKV
jgi:hypothetical protein